MSDSLTGDANAAPFGMNFPESRCFVAIAIAAIASAQATVPTSRNITKVLRIVAASPFAVFAQTAAHVYSQNPAPTRPSSKSMPEASTIPASQTRRGCLHVQRAAVGPH